MVRASLIAAIVAISSLMIAARVEAKSIAVAPANGPGKSGADKLEKMVRAKLAERGFDLVSEKALASAAKKLREDQGTAKVAEQAGADLLVTITIVKKKKKFSAQAKLIEVSTGKVKKTVKRAYAKATSAG